MHRFDGYDIEVTQGDTLFFKINLSGRDLPEGSVAYFTVKTGPRSDEVLIEKKIDATDELLDIRLTSADTNLPPKTYYWDVRVLIPLESGGYEVETPMEYASFTVLSAIGKAGDDANTPGMDADLPVLSVLVEQTREMYEDLEQATKYANEAAAQAVATSQDARDAAAKAYAAEQSAQSAADAANEEATGARKAAETASDAAEKANRMSNEATESANAADSAATSARNAASEASSAAESANTAASRAPYVGENGNWYIWNAENKMYLDSGFASIGEPGPQGVPGQPGADGVSPTVDVTGIGSGYRLTIRDKNGTQQVEVLNGKDVSSHLVNGTAYGSLRTLIAAPESEEYALGYGAYAAGDQCRASGRFAVARGVKTEASGYDAYAEGINTVASGSNSHAEGSTTTASASCAHAEGMSTTASELGAHAEGMNCVSDGQASHAEGNKGYALGNASHAEGQSCTAGGNCSHAEGRVTVASSGDQHVQGRYNIEDPDGRYAHIVGNGYYGSLSNAHTLDWNGNAWFAGDVYVGGNGQDKGVRLMKEGEVPEDLATKEYVDSAVSAVEMSQSNWNENDPQNPAYVKNRTHWLGARRENIFSNLELMQYEESGMFIITQPFVLMEGGKYTVTWNGTAYECTGRMFDDGEAPMVVLGNLDLMLGTGATEEPFMIAAAPPEYAQQGMYGVAMSFLGETEVTISLEGDVEEVHELDPKFIASTLTAIAQNFVQAPVTSDDNGKFLRVVDGAWAAVSVPNAEEASF